MSFILMCLVSCLFSADTNSAAHFDLAFAHGKINNLFWLVNLLFCSKLFWGMCCDKDQIVAEKTRLCLKLQVGELKSIVFCGTLTLVGVLTMQIS